MGLDIVVESKVSNLSFSFRAGSYSGFHAWRCGLLDMIASADYNVTGLVSEEVPFHELLNHSDCDGTLSQKECKELVKDFDAFADRAKTFVLKSDGKDASDEDREWWREKFETWSKAVRIIAVGGGRIVFC